MLRLFTSLTGARAQLHLEKLHDIPKLTDWRCDGLRTGAAGGSSPTPSVTEFVELFLPIRDDSVTVAPEDRGTERRCPVIDPVLQHLQQAKQTAAMVAQMMRLDPELMLPAALPLLAARLMDAGGCEEDQESDEAGPVSGMAAG